MMICLVSIVSMTVGGTVYILWRPDSLTVFAWLAGLGVLELVQNVRGIVAGFAAALPDWVYLSLPQGLWVLSGCLAVHSIWRSPCRWQQQLWMFLVLCLAVGGELGQATGLLHGVFDLSDLVLVLTAFVAAQLLSAMDGRPERFWRARV